jgi:hypothetical protein
METINELIINEANIWIGEKEIEGNKGFLNDRFQYLMEQVGWKKGEAWCAYFAELVWKLAYSKYNSLIVDELDVLFSAGAVRTWNNFRKDKGFECNKTP